VRALGRVLSFRFTREDLRALDARALVVGLLCTWAAGVGRYWDHPKAEPLQIAGVGSLVYVFALSALLWGVGAAVRARDWTYFRVLTFVALTAPPALLYAIPVERFLSFGGATQARVLFLGFVATYRVALYAVFAWRLGGRSRYATTVVVLLPLALLVFVLDLLNLDHAVFHIMSGGTRTTRDASYEIVVYLGLVSMLAAPVLLCLWLGLVFGKPMYRDRSP
jgi:hypothetical protein